MAFFYPAYNTVIANISRRFRNNTTESRHFFCQNPNADQKRSDALFLIFPGKPRSKWQRACSGVLDSQLCLSDFVTLPVAPHHLGGNVPVVASRSLSAWAAVCASLAA